MPHLSPSSLPNPESPANKDKLDGKIQSLRMVLLIPTLAILHALVPLGITPPQTSAVLLASFQIWSRATSSPKTPPKETSEQTQVHQWWKAKPLMPGPGKPVLPLKTSLSPKSLRMSLRMRRKTRKTRTTRTSPWEWAPPFSRLPPLVCSPCEWNSWLESNLN